MNTPQSDWLLDAFPSPVCVANEHEYSRRITSQGMTGYLPANWGTRVSNKSMTRWMVVTITRGYMRLNPNSVHYFQNKQSFYKRS